MNLVGGKSLIRDVLFHVKDEFEDSYLLIIGLSILNEISDENSARRTREEGVIFYEREEKIVVHVCEG